MAQDAQSLLKTLTEAFRDERWQSVGSLALSGGTTEDLVCDLVFDADWQGSLAARYFAAVDISAGKGAASID